MSLENNSWINTDHKLADAKENFDSFKASRGLLKIPSKQFALPPDGRFAESVECLDISKGNMFDPNSHHPGPLDPQHIHNPSVYCIDKKEAMDKSQQDFPFVYNMLPKIPNCTSSFDNVGQTFTYNYTLVNQMNGPLKCEICGLVFAHASLLNHHKRYHIHENHPISSPSHGAPPVPELHTCTVCNTSFIQACDLRAHELAAHNLPPREPSVIEMKEKPVDKCEDCHEVLPPEEEEESMQKLMIKRKKMEQVTKCSRCNGSGIITIPIAPSPEKPYRCNICDGTFSRYSSMWSHRKLHSGEKPFKCEVCRLAFARSSSLKNHIRVHTGERPYKCNVCGMQFSQAPHLKNHERIHSGERPYVCDVCHKTFARHSTLWNHRRIHTGEKPYRCDTCGSAFNQASHLRNHIKVHTGEKPFKCDICEVSFADKFALKRHRGVHEKYGQTARVNQQGTTSEQQTQQDQQEQTSWKTNPVEEPPQMHDASLQSPPPTPIEDIYVPSSAMNFPDSTHAESKQ